MSTPARVIVILVLVGFAWIMNMGWAVSTPLQRTGGLVLGGVALLVAAGLAFPRRGRMARRAVAGFIVVGYVAFFITELSKLLGGEPQALTGGQPSALLAGLGLLFWGIPMLIYALGGPSVVDMLHGRWHIPGDPDAGS